MTEAEYIIFCDESDKNGKFYSNFYGGLIVGATQYQVVTHRLNALKQSLNLFSEVKWEKVTQLYLPKYQALIRAFFAEVKQSNVKVRIMFRQNANTPQGLTETQQNLTYFYLYYQFVKHAFGLVYITPRPAGTRLRLYFDTFPSTRESAEQFKGFLLSLQRLSEFQKVSLTLAYDAIAEVRSHDHVLLQCLDVVLGAMAFRLNDKHKEKPPGARQRGKRTLAKETLYKMILGEIRQIRPGFNIGVSTGIGGDLSRRWTEPYMHWNFMPSHFLHATSLTKRPQKDK